MLFTMLSQTGIAICYSLWCITKGDYMSGNTGTAYSASVETVLANGVLHLLDRRSGWCIRYDGFAWSMSSFKHFPMSGSLLILYYRLVNIEIKAGQSEIGWLQRRRKQKQYMSVKLNVYIFGSFINNRVNGTWNMPLRLLGSQPLFDWPR